MSAATDRPHNPPGAFAFRVGERVTVTFPATGTVILGRIIGRTIEEALGKVYSIRDQRGRWQGNIPELYLTHR